MFCCFKEADEILTTKGECAMQLYFAYGSCMHEEDFRDSVPVFERWGRAILYDH